MVASSAVIAGKVEPRKNAIKTATAERHGPVESLQAEQKPGRGASTASDGRPEPDADTKRKREAEESSAE